MTLSRPAITALLHEHGLSPSRALGQNFVADPNTVRKIAHLAGVGPGDFVLEIGPGLGSLTLALAETGASVTAVEVDRHLIPILDVVTKGSGVTIICDDAMSAQWETLLRGAPRWTLVANLPYNVSVPVIMGLFERAPSVATMVVMVQREVAERLAARPGEPGYGAVSAKVAYYATGRIVASVPASVFVPRPNVASAVVRLDRRDGPPAECDGVTRDQLFAVINAGFSQRRKMLRGLLKDVATPETFARAGIDGARRGEELSLAEWARLTAAIEETA